jgi:hypothetical protein
LLLLRERLRFDERTKIEVSVNAYAVEKVQEVCASHLSTARFFAKNDTLF